MRGRIEQGAQGGDVFSGVGGSEDNFESGLTMTFPVTHNINFVLHCIGTC
jgi:hypothetical protein